jgi:phage host-nuclease inhibitor protein Gam
VQLASSLSEAEANGAVKSETARFGTLFGGNRLVVQQADLGTKGVRWRVRLPAASLADANAICAQIKAQGGDCFATNG